MHKPSTRTWSRLIVLVTVLPFAVLAVRVAAQAPAAAGKPPVHARAVKRLVITNAMVIYGNAKPAFGPVDILIEDGLIARVGAPAGPRGAKAEPPPDAVIDGTGKYVMPGIVNTHMHWHEVRHPSIPQPVQYERDLYLAAGVTTVRDVGSDFEKSKKWQAESNAHTIVAPRNLVYAAVERGKTGTPEEIRAWIRDIKQKGADGLKVFGFDRDQLAAILDEARKQSLRTTTHIAVEETTARDYVELGGDCIEHFYGVADAALDGIQNFPPEMNYGNEIHRFGRAGELYIQPNLNRDKLSELLDDMVKRHVAWSPTMSTYEAARDLIKNQNLPWYKDYLHPSLEEYYKPSFERHGAFWFGWTATQEVRWKHTYRVWMDALREFGVKGGTITTGDDAGYLYGALYGFGITREIELHEEAGFHPLEVLEHATVNGAKVVGLDDRLGRVRVGFVADLLVINGNPLENLRILNPYGTDIVTLNGKPVANYSSAIVPGDASVKVVHGGGIEWTIKDGIPYHVPALRNEIKDMVAKARAERARQTSNGR